MFDYIDGGADAELTLRANRAAFESVRFIPRMGAGIGAPELATTVLGTPVTMSVLLSPVGYSRLVHSEGDVAAVRAASNAGTIFTLSSMTGHTIEEVAGAAGVPPWFQLYFLGGRAGAERLIDRAQRADYAALVVTMDSQIPGNRERDRTTRSHSRCGSIHEPWRGSPCSWRRAPDGCSTSGAAGCDSTCPTRSTPQVVSRCRWVRRSPR